jgi:asparagine synthase (glutamine-hydrolysing)
MTIPLLAAIKYVATLAYGVTLQGNFHQTFRKAAIGVGLMHKQLAIQRVVDLTDLGSNVLFNMSPEAARDLVASGDVEAVRRIDGHFAIVATTGKTVRLARSLGRPLRYFIAKRSDGPELVAAERIDAIFRYLQAEGLTDQFHPSYTRMAPAHYITEVALVGCPDPNPVYRRFFAPPRASLPPDPDVIGQHYIQALSDEIAKWLLQHATDGPIGVFF